MRYNGIRAEGVRVLRALSKYNGPATTADLAERLDMTQDAVRKCLRRFVKLFYVDAVMGTGLALRFFITDGGRARLKCEEDEAAREEDDSIDNFPRPDSNKIVAQALVTQPNSVFDLARVMQR